MKAKPKNEWEIYSIEKESKPLRVVVNEHNFRISYNVAEKLGIKRWKYIQPSYNHSTKQIKLERVGRKDGFKMIYNEDYGRYTIYCKLRSFFELTNSLYAAERVDNVVILTPDD